MLRVLRLCSVFEPRDLTPAWVAYDPIGGMQNHVAELTRCLDRLGVAQLVVTLRLAGPADRARFGAHGHVIWTGLPVPELRQGWALLAARHVLGGGRMDLVHVHCGEDLAVLPLAWLAARRRGCPLVATVHLSVRHALRPVTARGAVLRAAGGAVEGWLLPGADVVIAAGQQGGPRRRAQRGLVHRVGPQARSDCRVKFGVLTGPPNVDGWPKPASSIKISKISKIFGAPSGGPTSLPTDQSGFDSARVLPSTTPNGESASGSLVRSGFPWSVTQLLRSG